MYFDKKNDEYYKKHFIKLWVSIDQDYRCTVYKPIERHGIQPPGYRHLCLLIDYQEEGRDLNTFQPERSVQRRAILGAVAMAGRYLAPIAINFLEKLTANTLSKFIDTTMQTLDINKNLELQTITDNQLQLKLRRNLTSKVRAYLVNKISGNTKAYLAKLARSMFLEKTKNQVKMAIVEDLTQLSLGKIIYSYAAKIEPNHEHLISLPTTKINGLWASIDTKNDQCRYNILAFGSTENCDFELEDKPLFSKLWENQHEVLVLIIKSRVIYQLKCTGIKTVLPLRHDFNLIAIDKRCDTYVFLKFLNNLQKIISSTNRDLSMEHQRINTTVYKILLSYTINQGHSYTLIIGYTIMTIVILIIIIILIIRLYNTSRSGRWMTQTGGETTTSL